MRLGSGKSANFAAIMSTKRLLASEWAPLVAVACNILLAMVVYTLCRLTFLAVNYSFFDHGLTTAHLLEMMRGGWVFDTSAIMYTCALYLLLMLLPVPAKETPRYHRACKWLFVVVNGLAVVVNLMDSVYFQYTSRRTTSTVFGEFSHEGNLAAVIGTEALRHWYLVLVAALFIGLLWKCYVTPCVTARRKPAWRYVLAQAVSLLVAAPLVVAGIRGGFTHAVRPITVSNANQYAERPIEAALVLNTPFSLIRTLGKNVFSDPRYFATEQVAMRWYTPLHEPAHADTTFTRKNVVILIVESLGKEYVGAMNRDLDGGRYKGYTPFVDSLAARSMTFRYSYANGRKSIDAMPSVLSSIPMMVEPFFLTPASMNDLSGIARLLAHEGYATAFFHGAQNGSMGFEAFARATGYAQYVGRTEFNDDPHFDGDKDFDGTWAIWDEPFLQFMLRRLNGYRQPFMATVFTASSHHPFKVPSQYEKVFPDEGGQPIHKCVRYTDMALRRFFEGASRQPWYRNTVFVLVADHTNQASHPEYQTDLGLYSIPILFFAPDGSLPAGERTDAIAQQIDITPTLLAILGYDKPYLAFGENLMDTTPQQSWAMNYNNGIYQFLQGDWMLQWDGHRTVAMYRFKTDPMLQRNLAGKAPEQAAMERRLKSIIQQYMVRMTTNRLTPGS